jgi:hypothetical protein
VPFSNRIIDSSEDFRTSQGYEVETAADIFRVGLGGGISEGILGVDLTLPPQPQPFSPGVPGAKGARSGGWVDRRDAWAPIRGRPARNTP